MPLIKTAKPEPVARVRARIRLHISARMNTFAAKALATKTEIDALLAKPEAAAALGADLAEAKQFSDALGRFTTGR